MLAKTLVDEVEMSVAIRFGNFLSADDYLIGVRKVLNKNRLARAVRTRLKSA